MGARLKTVLYTLPISGEASLATIVNSAQDTFFASIALRAHKSNSADITWRDSSGGSNGGYLEAREAATIDLSTTRVSAGNFFIAGTSGDQVYITVIG